MTEAQPTKEETIEAGLENLGGRIAMMLARNAEETMAGLYSRQFDLTDKSRVILGYNKHVSAANALPTTELGPEFIVTHETIDGNGRSKITSYRWLERLPDSKKSQVCLTVNLDNKPPRSERRGFTAADFSLIDIWISRSQEVVTTDG